MLSLKKGCTRPPSSSGLLAFRGAIGHARMKSSSRTLADQGGAAAPQSHHTLGLLAGAPLVYPSLLLLGGATTGILQVALLAAPAVLLLVFTPLLDFVLATERAIPVQPLRHLPPNSAVQFVSRCIPFLYVLLHISGALLACTAANFAAASSPSGKFLLLLAATGISAAVGSASAHELIHSRSVAHRVAGELYLLCTWHWAYSRAHHHHHLTVGTPLDHATAHLNEPYIHFMPRYILGGWAIAWKEEVQELSTSWQRRQRQKQRPAVVPENQAAACADADSHSAYTFRHSGSSTKVPLAACVPWRLLSALAAQIGITAGVRLCFGEAAVSIHLGAACISQALLALVDYGLHYGLVRSPQDHHGKYDPVTQYSSFNSAFLLENSALFSVLSHSDHHLSAAKPHTDLGITWPKTSRAASPLPAATRQSTQPSTPEMPPLLLPGIPMTAILLAALFMPPLWYRLVNPAAHAANVKQQQRAQELVNSSH